MGVLPKWSEYTSAGDYSLSAGGLDYTLTPDEWAKYQQKLGKETYKNISAEMNKAEYKSMTDAGKVEAIKDIISNAVSAAKRAFVESRGEFYYANTAAREKYTTLAKSAGISDQQAYGLYKQIGTGATDYARNNVVISSTLTASQKAKVLATFYTDSQGESLLPFLANANDLIKTYKDSKETQLISMKTPTSFTVDKVEISLTAAEQKTFKDVYIKFFNANYTAYISKKFLEANR